MFLCFSSSPQPRCSCSEELAVTCTRGRAPQTADRPAKSLQKLVCASCSVSDGQEQAGGRHFLSLSRYLGTSEILFHSQTCHVQKQPSPRGSDTAGFAELQSPVAEIPVPGQGKKLLGAKEEPIARILPPAYCFFPPAAACSCRGRQG